MEPDRHVLVVAGRAHGCSIDLSQCVQPKTNTGKVATTPARFAKAQRALQVMPTLFQFTSFEMEDAERLFGEDLRADVLQVLGLNDERLKLFRGLRVLLKNAIAGDRSAGAHLLSQVTGVFSDSKGLAKVAQRRGVLKAFGEHASKSGASAALEGCVAAGPGSLHGSMQELPGQVKVTAIEAENRLFEVELARLARIPLHVRSDRIEVRLRPVDGSDVTVGCAASEEQTMAQFGFVSDLVDGQRQWIDGQRGA